MHCVKYCLSHKKRIEVSADKAIVYYAVMDGRLCGAPRQPNQSFPSLFQSIQIRIDILESKFGQIAVVDGKRVNADDSLFGRVVHYTHHLVHTRCSWIYTVTISHSYSRKLPEEYGATNSDIV